MNITPIDPWLPLDAPNARADARRRQQVAQLKEDIRMLDLIREWDELSVEQKWSEWEIEANTEGLHTSRFSEVPGFTPRYCGGCASQVFLDYRKDPDGACPFDPTHPIAAVRPLGKAA